MAFSIERQRVGEDPVGRRPAREIDQLAAGREVVGHRVAAAAAVDPVCSVAAHDDVAEGGADRVLDRGQRVRHDPISRHLAGEVDQHGVACGGVGDGVAACSAVDHEIRAAGGARRGVDHIIAAEGRNAQQIPRLEVVDHDLRGQAVDHTRAILKRERDRVVAIRAVGQDRVGLTIAGRAAERAGEIDRDLGHVGAGKVADRNLVGAAERMKLDRLDVVRVHRDRGDVADEAHPSAVR